MPNEFVKVVEDVGHDIKIGAEDVGKAVVWLPAHLVQAEKVIASVIKDSPVVKADVLTLISKTVSLESLVANDIAAKGLNLQSDMATIQAIEDLVSYVRGQFFTDISTAYKDLKADVTPAA